MASSNTVGWQRVVVIATLSTAFAIFADRIGLVNAVSRMIGW